MKLLSSVKHETIKCCNLCCPGNNSEDIQGAGAERVNL
jgi:hypothetical protein